MEKGTYSYSFDREGVEKIYRNEAVMIVGMEWKITHAEKKIDAGATCISVSGGFDPLYVHRS